MSFLGWILLGAGALLTALLLAVFHWVPWLDPARLIRNYILGVAGIVAGFALWRLPQGDWLTVVGLLAITLVGGLVTLAVRGVDRVAQALRREEMAERCDDELSQ
jgi:hypothetical protein